MARGTAIRDRRRPLRQRAAQSDKGRRAAPLVATAPAFGFGLRQIVAPGVLCFAGHLRIDEAVDGLVGDDRSVLLPSEAAGHLLGGPAVLELRQDRGAERAVAVELGSCREASPSRSCSAGPAVAVKRFGSALPASGREEGCRNLAERMEGIMPGKLRPVIEGDRLAPLGGKGASFISVRWPGRWGQRLCRTGARGDQQAGVAPWRVKMAWP